MAKVDCTFTPDWWHTNTGVEFTQRFFLDPDYRVEADRAMRACLYKMFGALGLGEADPKPRPLLDTDLLAGEYLQAQLLGCEVRFTENQAPEVLALNLDDTQAMALAPPDLSAHPLWRQYEAQLQALSCRYGYAESYLDMCGVQNLALSLRGEALMMDYYSDPDIANHVLDVATRCILAVAERIGRYTPNLAQGVSAIIKQTAPSLYLTSNCTVEMVSANTYEEFLLPFDLRLAQAHPPFGVHHCGQSCQRLAESYRKIPGLALLEVGAGSDVAAVCRTCGDLPLNLRFSPIFLLRNSPRDIRGEVRRMFTAAGEHHLHPERISMSCVGIDAATPDRNVEAFLAAVQEIR